VPDFNQGFSLDRHLESIEAELLRRALEQAEGNRATAARLLGVTPRSLRYLIRKHDGTPPQ
jgi:transcriptional regulator with GAF, ATPase, and Fis domain